MTVRSVWLLSLLFRIVKRAFSIFTHFTALGGLMILVFMEG